MIKFYETDSEFILLEEGEEIPYELKVYELKAKTYCQGDKITIDKLNLGVEYWTAAYPDSLFTTFIYRGLEFRIRHRDLSGKELVDFLNSLLGKNPHIEIEKHIIESLKNDGRYIMNTSFSKIEKLERLNNTLKEENANIKHEIEKLYNFINTNSK